MRWLGTGGDSTPAGQQGGVGAGGCIVSRARVVVHGEQPQREYDDVTIEH